jgi:hypothetical protein
VEKENILDINFLTPNLGWEKQILSMLGSTQKIHYWDSPLHVIAVAIAIKTEHLGCYAWNVNQSAGQANEILKRNAIETTKAMENHMPYSFKDNHILYSIIGQTEAFLIELKSVLDLTMRYANTFYRIMFGLRKKKSDIQRELKKNHIDLGWVSELDAIRNDFVHHYSPWLKFRKRGRAYDYIIALPDLLLEKLKGNKRHADKYLDAPKINDFAKKSDQFFNAIISLLKKELIIRPA